MAFSVYNSIEKPCVRANFALAFRRVRRQGPTARKQGAMLDVILYEPEIPPNTGNIIRLCANTGVRLHLVKPLGFSLDDRQMRRAGLDYHEYATVKVHEAWTACAAHFEGRRMFAVSTKGTRRYDANGYLTGDVFVFGPETRGLPAEVLQRFSDERCIRIPMLADSRSLNLSNAVAIVVYEALRQLDFGRCS
jgi:tRNA (cytidine/uridine-2'-O-)-methyltransferase